MLTLNLKNQIKHTYNLRFGGSDCFGGRNFNGQRYIIGDRGTIHLRVCLFMCKIINSFDLLELLDLLVASAFLLGAILILDSNRDGKIKEMISSKKKRKQVRTTEHERETERKREKREIGSSNVRGIFGRGK